MMEVLNLDRSNNVHTSPIKHKNQKTNPRDQKYAGANWKQGLDTYIYERIAILYEISWVPAAKGRHLPIIQEVYTWRALASRWIISCMLVRWQEVPLASPVMLKKQINEEESDQILQLCINGCVGDDLPPSYSTEVCQ